MENITIILITTSLVSFIWVILYTSKLKEINKLKDENSKLCRDRGLKDTYNREKDVLNKEKLEACLSLINTLKEDNSLLEHAKIELEIYLRDLKATYQNKLDANRVIVSKYKKLLLENNQYKRWVELILKLC